MLSYLSELEHLWGPLRLFRYLTFRALFASGTSMVIGFLIGPFVIAKLRQLKAGQVFRDQSQVGALAVLHQEKKDTPTMGGIMIYISVTAGVLLWARPNVWILVSLFVFTALGALGFADDYLKISRQNTAGVSGRTKLIWQMGVSVVALGVLLLVPESSSKVRELWVPFLKEPLWEVTPVWFLLPFFLLVISGSSNAINLTDGVDGLAIGCTISVALVYSLMAYAAGHLVIADYLFISYIPGTGELAIVCGCLVGAGMAFLWYNAHPADVFMGDTGALALGGLIGAVAFMVHQPLTLIIVGGIFVMEAGSVILQVGSMKIRKKRIFRITPIHHHFELKGWKESKLVIRFWILSLIFALIGLGTLKLR